MIFCDGSGPGIPGTTRRSGKMTIVVTYPDSTKASLQWRLTDRARQRWPQLARVQVRHRGNFSYVDGVLPDGQTLKLCRLRYVGSAHDCCRSPKMRMWDSFRVPMWGREKAPPDGFRRGLGRRGDGYVVILM